MEHLCQVQGLCLLEMLARAQHLFLKILSHACVLVAQSFVIILVENRNGVLQDIHNFVTNLNRVGGGGPKTRLFLEFRTR